jgi:hypothetical protein
MIDRAGNMFVQLKAVGICSDKGKTVLGGGGYSKMISKSETPVHDLARAFICELIQFRNHPDKAALQGDVKALHAWLSDVIKANDND